MSPNPSSKLYKAILPICTIENDDIAATLKEALLYREGVDSGAAQRIADMCGQCLRWVYAVLDGNIKVSLRFLHAAVIASGGDPDIKRFLEPEGWRLAPLGEIAPSEDIEHEMGDVHVAAGRLHGEVRDAMGDGRISKNERANITKQAQRCIAELQDVISLVEVSR